MRRCLGNSCKAFDFSRGLFTFQEYFGLSSFAYGLFFGAMALGITVGAAFSSRMSSPEAAMLAGAVGLLGASVLSLIHI